MRPVHYAIAVVGLIHIGIMVLELGPGTPPFVMQRVTKMWLDSGKITSDFSEEHRVLVVAIVRNAGVYNGIVGAALIAAAFLGRTGFLPQATLLLGVIAAGLIGMLLSPFTIAQSLIGAAVLIWLFLTRAPGSVNST